MAEYALLDVNKPIGVSNHQVGRELPEALKNNLPTVEQLEMELNTVTATPEDEESLD